MKYYSITASVTEETEDGFIDRQIPTFYLHRDVQGIMNHEHAEKIARTIINPTKNPKLTVFVKAVLICE